MKSYHPSNSSIHVLARSLIIQGDSVVICKHNNLYFLPGGHVESGESLMQTLEREFIEELGGFPHSVPVHIGVCEHQFDFKDGAIQHEINHVFVTEVAADVVFESRESFLSFEKIKISDVATIELLPEQLKPALVKWFADKREFFVGM